MGKLQGISSFFVPGPPAKPGDTYQPIVKFLLDNINGETIIDLGGGEGAYSLELKNYGYDVLVADINSLSLSIAEKSGLKTRLLKSDESLESNIADTVIMVEVLEHVPDPEDFLKSALNAAKKRVLFTMPCTENFVDLFNIGLTYHHIAVSDHLWHFSYEELRQILEKIGVKYTLKMDDYLCPSVTIKLLKDCIHNRYAFVFLMLVYRIISKLGCVSKCYPTRFYGIIEKI